MGPTFIWWRQQMETFSALLALCAGIHRSPVNSPHKGQCRGALMFLDLRLNKRLSKQWWGWWFETQLRPLWRHWNDRYTGKSKLWVNIIKILCQCQQNNNHILHMSQHLCCHWKQRKFVTNEKHGKGWSIWFWFCIKSFIKWAIVFAIAPSENMVLNKNKIKMILGQATGNGSAFSLHSFHKLCKICGTVLFKFSREWSNFRCN